MKAIHNRRKVVRTVIATVSDRKDTKLLKAIHNNELVKVAGLATVSDRKDTKLLKAIHNRMVELWKILGLFQTAKILNF